MSGDEKRPDGHCSDDTAWSQIHDDYAKKTRADLALGERSDFAVANAVFMADRNDFQLILYTTAAKERIRWLSIKLADAIARERELVKALEGLADAVDVVSNSIPERIRYKLAAANGAAEANIALAKAKNRARSILKEDNR